MFQGYGGSSGLREPVNWIKEQSSLCIKKSWIRKPSEMLAIVEKPTSLNTLGSHGLVGLVDRPENQLASYAAPKDKSIHGSRWNYLFADGHVQALLLEETVRPKKTYYDTIASTDYMWTRDPND